MMDKKHLILVLMRGDYSSEYNNFWLELDADDYSVISTEGYLNLSVNIGGGLSKVVGTFAPGTWIGVVGGDNAVSLAENMAQAAGLVKKSNPGQATE